MSFRATFRPPGRFTAHFSTPATIQATFSPHIVVPIADYYEGPYEVTPRTEEQVLETQMKTMSDDLTVHAVPYFEVSNQYGETVYIASEVD